MGLGELIWSPAIMLYLLLTLAVIIVAALVYLALQPGEIQARRSLPIKRDRADVFDTVRDLRTWREWSPWLLHEPDALLDYSDAPDQQNGWYSIIAHLRMVKRKWDRKRPSLEVYAVDPTTAASSDEISDTHLCADSLNPSAV
jgi:hypothetical protein